MSKNLTYSFYSLSLKKKLFDHLISNRLSMISIKIIFFNFIKQKIVNNRYKLNVDLKTMNLNKNYFKEK